MNFISLLTILLILAKISFSQPDEPIRDPSSSVYGTITNISNHLQGLRESVASMYRESTQNDTTNLANWEAYSKILKQINYAMFDRVSEIIMDNNLVSISNECKKSLTDFLIALIRQESWAYKIIDSNGFLSSGILEGSYANFGDFDECVNSGDSDVKAQYCLIKYQIEIPTNRTDLITQDLVFNTTRTLLEQTFFADFLRYAHYFKVRQARSALCTPSGCTKSDIQTLVDYAVQVDKLILQVDTCQTLNDIDHYSLLQKIIIATICFISIVIILATIVEWSRNRNKQEKFQFVLKKLSIRQNVKSLLNSSNNDYLASINGIRVLTMFWLIYCHTYLLSVKETFRSSNNLIESLFDMKMHFIFNGWPFVETFFILSALLHSYHVLKVLQSRNRINILQIIANRIARLWPSLWFIVAIVFVIPNLAQGPLWVEIMDQQVNSCYKNWWMVISFTANIRRENLCHIHTWYLSADLQLFLISFIFILFIHKYQKKAILVMSICNLMLCIFITVYFYLNHFHPTILFNQISEIQLYREMFEIYLPTYIHSTPYLVGVVTGYFLLIHKHKTKFSKLFIILWIPSILFILLVIMSSYFFTVYTQTPIIIQNIYAGFHRLVWSLSIAFIIFSCEISQSGNLIKDFLSSKIFGPLSKLSYTIYLVHYIIIWTRYAYARQTLIFSHITMLNEFIINSIYSFISALIIHLLVEAPIFNLYLLYIGKKDWNIGEIQFKDMKERKSITIDQEIGNIEMR